MKNVLMKLFEMVMKWVRRSKECVCSRMVKLLKHRGKHSSATLQHLSEVKKGKRSGRFLYRIFSPCGEVYESDNLRETCRKHYLHQPTMVAVSNGRQKDYKGWFVEKIDVLDYGKGYGSI